MSWLSVLNSIGGGIHTGVAVATPFAPVLSAIPGFGPVFATVLTAMTTAQALIPQEQAEKRLPVVVATVNAAHPGIDQAALTQNIEQLLVALKGMQAAAAATAKLTPATPPAK